MEAPYPNDLFSAGYLDRLVWYFIIHWVSLDDPQMTDWVKQQEYLFLERN